MFRNENIICISSIDWDFIWQGHQEIMSILARNGNRVLYIENTGVRVPKAKDLIRIKNRFKNWSLGVTGIREVDKNIYVFSPLVLPFPYSRIARWINWHFILSILEKWFKVMNFNSPIIWLFLPTPLSLDLMDNINYKAALYYCIDNFRASSSSAKKIEQSEINLLKKVDLVFATSGELYEYCFKFNDNAHLFPFTVDFQKFEKVRLGENIVVEEIAKIKKPIVGYVGGVHKWIDFKLIETAARQFPECSFVFVGPVQTDVSLVSGLRNVYFLGKKDHDRIPAFISNFDICIIPYVITEYTNNVYPTKLNEYLAMGKPVVSTALPEILRVNAKNDNLVYAGNDYAEFCSYIHKAKNYINSAEVIKKRIAYAENNSWSVTVEQMSALLEDAIRRKTGQGINWQDKILKLYSVSRRKFFKIGIPALFIYSLVFYTPLMWILAEPLKISQPPRESDCILVLAGGVGESGRAGQGHEERTKYAVELYRDGYAKHIIISSGYVNIFKEPMVMKALAVSLGVPQEAVILEDKAANTFENIEFSKKILDKNRWNNILLVTSPYHMRRVSLVFNKIAKDIKVCYTPILNSIFYAHPERDVYGRRIWKRINLKQIDGIVHEYLAILYYWWKQRI